MNDLDTVIGSDLAAKVRQRFGGQVLYIPSTATGSPLAKLIGLEAFDRLRKSSLAGRRVYVAKLPQTERVARNRQIIASTATVQVTAQRFGLSGRQILSIRGKS